MSYQELFELIETDSKAAFREIGLALNEDPDDPNLIALYARLFQRDDNFGLARVLWREVLRRDPSPSSALYNNLGLCELAIGKKQFMQEGERNLRKALARDPNNVAAHNNLALYHLHNGDHQQCLALSTRAIELAEPESKPAKDAHETRAYANLMLGNWEQGWQDWDWSQGSKYRPHFADAPLWAGEKGIDLLLRGEQGIGDEISFASVIPDVVKDNRLTLECDYRLEGLFRRSFPNVDVHGTRRGEKRGKFEGHTHRALLGSACRYYRNSVADFPGTPYLVADPERRVQWRALLDSLPGKKVGIAWTGGKSNSFRDRRSFTLEQWKPILQVPGITFICLEYNDPGDMPENVKHWPRATAKGVDYDDTAALVAELDWVVSATTATVHLCGALGKKALVLVPAKPRWFYGKSGDSIPWYSSVEIFRQAKQDWPIEAVAKRCAELNGAG